MSTPTKKDLIIITTKPAFLPGSGNPKILLRESSCIAYTPKQEGLTGFAAYRDSPYLVYRLNEGDSLIFATSCLRKEDSAEGTTVPQDKRHHFIPSLFEEVVSLLSEKEKESIERIFVIAHGFDLNMDDRGFKKVESTMVLNEFKKTSLGPQTLVTGDFQQENKGNEVGVFFIAFSHVPGRHAFYDVLARFDEVFGKTAKLSKSDIITRLIKFECGQTPEDNWGSDWEAPEKGLLEGLSFEFYYIKDKKVIQIGDEKGWEGKWFSKTKGLFAKTSTKQDNTVNIVFVSLTQLAAHNDTYIVFLKQLFGAFSLKEKVSGKCPTLFIGCKDIMDDENVASTEGLRLDRRYRFLDSSIWFRYAALENPKTMASALHTFQWAWHHKLYQKNVCQEYVELYARLLENSSLKEFGDGHALNVFPFVFHSEYKMEQERKKLFEKKIKPKNLKWNFLLVDDYAELELREPDNFNSRGPQHYKGSIIKALIDSPPRLPSANEQTPGSLIANFWPSESVNDALENYFFQKSNSEKLPDIILLDYLFSHPRESQHYGTKLLKAIIKKKKGVRKSRSVAQKYWIHPISVFNEAMFSELQEKSYQHFEPQWNLARGADPINTPLLFRRSLLEFMDVQAELLLFDQKELWEFLTDQEIKNADNGVKHSRINQPILLNAFRNFLEQFSADEGIDPGSAIGQSARKHMQSDDRDALALRDHMRQILFLFAYTSGFDFPAIQREFSQIDRIYKSYFNKNIGNENKKEHLAKLKKTMDILAEWVYSTSEKYKV